MTTLNLTECCLLEASGELSEHSRERLQEYVARRPAARRELEEIRRDMALLRNIPLTELSAAERKAISEKIKKAVRRKLTDRERQERASRRWKFVSHVLSGVGAAAAAVLLIAGVVAVDRTVVQRHEKEKMARMDRATDRLATYNEQQNPVDQEITDVQSSIQQLQEEGPTMVAGLDNREMANVFDALTAIPSVDVEMDMP